MHFSDPSKPTDEILDDVRKASILAFNNRAPSLAFQPLAVLMVRLSRNASDTADKNIRVQNNLIRLTVAILAISALQLLFGAAQVVRQFAREPERVEQKPADPSEQGQLSQPKDNAQPVENAEHKPPAK